MRSLVLIRASLLISIAAMGPLRSAPFIRGDANADSVVDVSDSVSTLGFLFLGNTSPECLDALDANDDGVVDVSDPVYGLSFLFSGGPDIPAPFPACGDDPTGDALECESFEPCPVVERFADEELELLVSGNVPPVACVPADAARFEVAGVQITACASDEASPNCGGGGAPGCPVEITSVEGRFERAARGVVIHVVGRIEDFPITIGEGIGSLVCQVDAYISGDVVIAYAGTPVPGGVQITAIGTPAVENVELTLSASGGILCRLIESQAELFAEAIAEQLEGAAAAVADSFETEVVGSVVCSE